MYLQDLDLMRRGRKVECAYGYCDIRQFTDTVECLQDQVTPSYPCGSLDHQRLPPGSPTVTAWITYGYRLDLLRLQPGSATVTGYGCR